jgi:nicotinate-nucleotide adenylyltransferase
LICLFGGTFDPVHLGHLHAAEAVCDALGVSEVRLVLSARPSHRERTSASMEHRWAMLQLACAGHPRLVPDDREMRRSRPSYTVDTLEELHHEQPGVPLWWVIGSDAFALLPSWHRWERVLELASLIVLKRPGHPLELDPVLEALLERCRVESVVDVRAGGILILSRPMEDVAARDIRAALAAGKPVGHLLPEPVANYISRHHLYQPEERSI